MNCAVTATIYTVSSVLIKSYKRLFTELNEINICSKTGHFSTISHTVSVAEQAFSSRDTPASSGLVRGDKRKPSWITGTALFKRRCPTVSRH